MGVGVRWEMVQNQKLLIKSNIGLNTIVKKFSSSPSSSFSLPWMENTLTCTHTVRSVLISRYVCIFKWYVCACACACVFRFRQYDWIAVMLLGVLHSIDRFSSLIFFYSVCWFWLRQCANLFSSSSLRPSSTFFLNTFFSFSVFFHVLLSLRLCTSGSSFILLCAAFFYRRIVSCSKKISKKKRKAKIGFHSRCLIRSMYVALALALLFCVSCTPYLFFAHKFHFILSWWKARQYTIYAFILWQRENSSQPRRKSLVAASNNIFHTRVSNSFTSLN